MKYCLRKSFTLLCYGMQFLLYSLVSIFSFPLHLIFSHENGFFNWGTFYIRSKSYLKKKEKIDFEIFHSAWNSFLFVFFFLVWLSSSGSKKTFYFFRISKGIKVSSFWHAFIIYAKYQSVEHLLYKFCLEGRQTLNATWSLINSNIPSKLDWISQ